MKESGVRILMLGERTMAPSSLLVRLLRKGCDCWFAESAHDGMKLFQEHKFQLILNTGRIPEAIHMLPALAGSHCTVFSAFPVEHGYWWLPIMYLGRECLGAPAMRTAEFLDALDRTVVQIRVTQLTATPPPSGTPRFIPNMERLAS